MSTLLALFFVALLAEHVFSLGHTWLAVEVVAADDAVKARRLRGGA